MQGIVRVWSWRRAAGEVVEDATDGGTCRDEGDHPHHASTAGAEEGIDFIDPADELCPAPRTGGRRRQGVGVRA